MIKALWKIVDKTENAPTSFWLWISTFTAIILVRLAVEFWLSGFKSRSGLFLFYEFTHTFLFFLTAYLLFAWTVKILLKTGIKKIYKMLLWGYLIIISPPVLDHLISHGQGYWSFYDFGGLKDLAVWFFTFFDRTPEIGITYGVRIEVAASLLFIFIYSLLKLGNSKSEYRNPKQYQISNIKNQKFGNWKLFRNLKLEIRNLGVKNIVKAALKSFGITIIAYLIFFILGTFPSWTAIAFQGFYQGFFSITDIHIVQMFLTPAKIFSREIPDIVSSLNIKMSLVYALVVTAITTFGLYLNFREKFISFLKNFRFPQLIYHGGLLTAGLGMGIIFSRTYLEINFFNSISYLVALIAVAAAWLASVVVNDIHDKEIDKITNNSRPLVKNIFSPEQYKILGIMLFTASILFSAIVNFKFALLLIAYQAIAWIYSSPPLRLKRFAFVSTFVSAIASLMVLFSGFLLASPEQNIENLPFSIIALLVISYTFSLPIKDLKDIEGDKKEGVYTVPVFFGEEWGRIITGSGLFISFVLSVLLLNEPRLFWWAILFGAVSFWLVLNKKIHPRLLLWWILGTVSLYGIILVKIIFL
jgi:4-hydroxybenzoate polyprenyltransferase